MLGIRSPAGSDSKWRQASGRALALGLSVVLLIGMAELGLWLFWPAARRPGPPPTASAWRELLHRASAIPGLAYELAPDADVDFQGTRVRTNHWGMRGPEVVPEEAARWRRIAVLGDSWTFGYGVSVDEAYPSVLESVLNERSVEGSPHWQVLNFGVSGYCTRDEALVLKHKASRFGPQLIVIGYVLNDPEIDPIQPLHHYFHRARWWEHSSLWQLARNAKMNRDVDRLGEGDYYRYLHAEPRKWRSVVESFDDIARTARELRAEVVLLIFPRLVPWSTYPYHDVHSQVREAGTASGFHVVDLYPAFARFDPLAVRISELDPHPNRLGHSLIATILGELLLDDPCRFFPNDARLGACPGNGTAP